MKTSLKIGDEPRFETNTATILTRRKIGNLPVAVLAATVLSCHGESVSEKPAQKEPPLASASGGLKAKSRESRDGLLKKLLAKPGLDGTELGTILLEVTRLSEAEIHALLRQKLPQEQKSLLLDRYCVLLGTRSPGEVLAYLNGLTSADSTTQAAVSAGQAIMQSRSGSLNETLALAERLADARTRSGFIRGVLVAGISKDPRSALPVAASYRDQMGGMEFKKLVRDAAASFRHAGKFPEVIEMISTADYRLLGTEGLEDEFGTWSVENHAAAKEFLQRQPADAYTAPLYYPFARTWADRNLTEACEWARSLPPGAARDGALAGVVLHLRKKNVHQASQLAGEIQDQKWRAFAMDLVDRQLKAGKAGEAKFIPHVQL